MVYELSPVLKSVVKEKYGVDADILSYTPETDEWNLCNTSGEILETIVIDPMFKPLLDSLMCGNN